MKWLLIIAVVAGGGYFAYDHFYNPGGSTTSQKTESAEGFLGACKHVSRKIPKVDEYCACLQEKGVKSMMMLGAKPEGQAAIADCQDRVGYSTATPGLNPEH